MYQDSIETGTSAYTGQTDKKDLVDFSRVFRLIRNNWYYLLASIVLAGTAAFFINEYTIPVYQMTSSIMVLEDDNMGVGDADRMLQGIGLSSAAQNLYNQMYVLSSWNLIDNTLSELPFDVEVYRKGLFRKVSFYPDDPIVIITDNKEKFPSDIDFIISRSEDDQIRVSSTRQDDFELDTLVGFGQKIPLEGGSFAILKSDTWEAHKDLKRIYFRFRKRETIIREYQDRMNIGLTNREGTIIRISLEGTKRVKEIDFLNQLTSVFHSMNLDKKNREALRIINFIDEQLVDVEDSLMIAENRLQNFRSRNRIMDISAQGQQIIEQGVTLEDAKARLKLETNYYEYLNKYLSNDTVQEAPVAPARMGIDDPLLTTLIQQLVELQSEYFISGVGDKNPLQSQQIMRIENTKQSIKETLNGLIMANQMAQSENLDQIRTLNSKASSLPVTERKLLGIERKFELSNVTYTYLLQQRAEAQIRKASNSPDTEIVDYARSSRNPVSPRVLIIYALFGLFGFTIPLVTLLIVDSSNVRINSVDDLRQITNLPMIGQIPLGRLKYQTIVLNEPQSNIAEAFRSLRARMQFFIRENQNCIVLVSSSMPSEGKSFTALNLASVYSLAGNKTVLVGCDLRRPVLALDFGLDNSKGISTYLIGRESVNAITFSTTYANLDVIPSGPVPPNPAELIASEKMKKLFDALRKKYEIIVVDSAPIGVVSDTLSLTHLADTTIMVVRQEQTSKNALVDSLSELKIAGIHDISLLHNGVSSRNSRYGKGYRNYYKAGYGAAKSK